MNVSLTPKPIEELSSELKALTDATRVCVENTSVNDWVRAAETLYEYEAECLLERLKKKPTHYDIVTTYDKRAWRTHEPVLTVVTFFDGFEGKRIPFHSEMVQGSVGEYIKKLAKERGIASIHPTFTFTEHYPAKVTQVLDAWIKHTIEITDPESI